MFLSWCGTSKQAWISCRRLLLLPSATSPVCKPMRTSEAGYLVLHTRNASNCGESRTAKPDGATKSPARPPSSSPVRTICSFGASRKPNFFCSWINFRCRNAPHRTVAALHGGFLAGGNCPHYRHEPRHDQITHPLWKKNPPKVVTGDIAMKKPREVLLEHHQTAIPKLNAIRRRVLSTELPANPPPHPWPLRCLSVPWRELIWPCRRIWAGLAVAWLVILAASISLGDNSRTVAKRPSEPSPEMILAYWRQERLLADLIEPHPRLVVAPPKPALPKPRSERRTEFLVV